MSIVGAARVFVLGAAVVAAAELSAAERRPGTDAGAADSEGWLAGLPPAARVESAYPASDPMSYARRAAAFAVLVDYIEVRGGIDDVGLMGPAVDARLSPRARQARRQYVGGGYSKILTGGAWEWFTNQNFREEVLLRFVPRQALVTYETMRNRIPDVPGPWVPPEPEPAPEPAPKPAPPAAEPVRDPDTLSTNPRVRELLVAGEKYRDAKDCARSVEAYKRAAALEPSNSHAVFGLAIGHDCLKQWRPATVAMKRYLTLVQPFPGALLVLGDDHLQLKEYEQALQAFRRILALKTDAKHLAEAHFMMGRTYSAMKKRDAAAPEYEEAARLDPDMAGVDLELGKAYYFLDRYPEARAALERAVRAEPDSAAAYYFLGLTCILLEDQPAAFQAVRALQPLDRKLANDLHELIVGPPKGSRRPRGKPKSP